MKTLYLLSGIPGSGKSTWAARQIAANDPETAIIISRDEIRFSMLQEGDDYFAYEDEVFEHFVKSVNTAIHAPFIKRIYVDQTSLNDKSRNKILKRLNLTDVEVINVVFTTPLEICKTRNNKRLGKRKVPEKIIENMYNGFHKPNNGYKIIVIDERGNEVK